MRMKTRRDCGTRLGSSLDLVVIVTLVVVWSGCLVGNANSQGVNSNALSALLPVVARNGGVVNSTVSVDLSPSCFVLSAQFVDSDDATLVRVQQLTITATFYDVDQPEQLGSTVLLSLSSNLTPTPYNTPYVSKLNELTLSVFDQLDWSGAGRICLYIQHPPSNGNESTEIHFGVSVDAIYLTEPESVYNSTVIADFQPGECQYYHILPPNTLHGGSFGPGSVVSLNILSNNPLIAINVSSQIIGPSPFYQSNVTMIFYPPTNTTNHEGYYLAIWNTGDEETDATVTIYWSAIRPKELEFKKDYDEAESGWNYFFITLPTHKTTKSEGFISVPVVSFSAAFTSVPTLTSYFDIYTSVKGVPNRDSYDFYSSTIITAVDSPSTVLKLPIGDSVGDTVFVSVYIPDTTLFTSLKAVYSTKNYTFVANTSLISGSASGYFEVPKEDEGHYWIASLTCSYSYVPTSYFFFNLDNPSQCISSQSTSRCYSSSIQIASPVSGLWFFDITPSYYCSGYTLNVLPKVFVSLNKSDTNVFYGSNTSPTVAVFQPDTVLEQLILQVKWNYDLIYVGTGRSNLLRVLSSLPRGLTSLPDGWTVISNIVNSYYYYRPAAVFNNVPAEPLFMVFPATSSYYTPYYVDVYGAATIGTVSCTDMRIQSIQNGWKYYRVPPVYPASSLTVTLSLSNIGNADLWISTGTTVIPSPNNVTTYDRSIKSVKTVSFRNSGYVDAMDSVIGINTTSIARFTLTACIENANSNILPIPLTYNYIYGGKVYYYEVTESQLQRGIDTILLQIRASSTYYPSSVYIKHGAVPLNSDFDYNVTTTTAQMVVIHPVQLGYYYIRFESASSTYYNFTATSASGLLTPLADKSYVNASFPTLGFKVYKFTITNNDYPLQVNIPYASLPTSYGVNFNVVLQHSYIPSSYQGEFITSIPINTFAPTYAFTIENPHLGDWYILAYGYGEAVLQVNYSGYTLSPSMSKSKDKNKIKSKSKSKSKSKRSVPNKVKLTEN